MKKIKSIFFREFSKKAMLVLLGFVLGGLVVNMAIAAWQDPTEDPTGGNVAKPINISTTTQTKVGDLCTDQGQTYDGPGRCLGGVAHCVTRNYDTSTSDECPPGYETWGGAYTQPSGEMMCCTTAD